MNFCFLLQRHTFNSFDQFGCSPGSIKNLFSFFYYPSNKCLLKKNHKIQINKKKTLQINNNLTIKGYNFCYIENQYSFCSNHADFLCINEHAFSFDACCKLLFRRFLPSDTHTPPHAYSDSIILCILFCDLLFLTHNTS